MSDSDDRPSAPPREPADGRFSLRWTLATLVVVCVTLTACRHLGASASLACVITAIVVWVLTQHRLPRSAWLAAYLAMSAAIALIGFAAIAAHLGM